MKNGTTFLKNMGEGEKMNPSWGFLTNLRANRYGFIAWRVTLKSQGSISS